MERLAKRRDFVAASKAMAKSMPGVVMQVRSRNDDKGPRLGFTCTKKLGNAVTRNRIRRRLREAARLVMAEAARSGHDYVLIGRAGTEKRSFEALKKDIISALAAVHTQDRTS
jgi:ribonuclease P protein component